MRTNELVVTSHLGAPADAVWDAVTTMEGVNFELGPWLRMTAPAGVRLDPELVTPGERLFRSRLLLGGVLPIDFDDLTFVAIGPSSFHERSRMLSARVWEHERHVEPDGPRCFLTDRVWFDPRVRLAAPLQRRIVRAVFQHRHERLNQRFGARRRPGATAG